MSPVVITFIFPTLGYISAFSLARLTLSTRYVKSSLVPTSCVASSAYLGFATILPPTLIPLSHSYKAYHVSAYILNSSGDSIHPCRTPLPMSMLSVFPNSVLTVASWLVYSLLSNTIRCHIPQYHPQSFMVDTIKGLPAVDEAHVQFYLVFPGFSIIHLRLAIWSRVSLPRLNPACSIGSSGIRNTSSLLCMIRRSTLLACEIKAIVR